MISGLPAAVEGALARFAESMRLRFGSRLRELRLYGSYARGAADEDSDVDVLVVIDDMSETERREVFDLAYDADSVDRESWTCLSPLAYSTAQAADLRSRERRLLRDIDTEGLAL